MDDTAVVGEPGYEECRQRNPEWSVRELDDYVAADLEVSLDGRELKSCNRNGPPKRAVSGVLQGGEICVLLFVCGR
jgi:hypothetical protein